MTARVARQRDTAMHSARIMASTSLHSLGPALCCVLACPASAHDAQTPIDRIVFADARDRDAHHVDLRDGAIVAGGLGQNGVQLHAPPSGWRGGSIAFRLKVNPDELNYLTVRLWGGETVDGNLILSCDGKQVGDRVLSDHDALDFGSHAPQFPGAFFYRTTALPMSVTRGRNEISCEVEATGPIFSYGATFDKFQRPMSVPSRIIYALETHASAWAPAISGLPDGRTDVAPRRPGPGRIVPQAAGSEVLSQIRARIESSAEGLVKAQRPLGQHEILFLAQLRHKSWTRLATDPQLQRAIVRGIDHFIAAYAANPDIVRDEKSTWNPDWFGFGPIGQTLALDPASFAPYLDEQVAWTGATRISRRAALTRMLMASRDWLRTHRRFYTNQSMIVDCYGIYLANRGLAVVSPQSAFSEERARRYLYEAVGIEEWRGDDLPDGGHSYDAGGPDGTKAQPYRVPHGYHLVSRTGLTRELGYVGNYGEVQDWVGAIYDATRSKPGAPGDERIRAQLAKIARARAPFRYPGIDDDGFLAMRMMSDVGWRDLKSPGEVTYLQRPRPGAGSPFEAAVFTDDPQLVGYAQQMIGDNALWPSLAATLADRSFRTTYGLLNVIDDVADIASHALQDVKLPMAAGQPDFAFADPETGVVALKRGEERFYASLYWRANRGVNNLGRVWLGSPSANRIATVAVETGFVPGGAFWTRPDKVVLVKGEAINRAYGKALAEAGERLPLVRAPEGLTVVPGEDSVFAGRGESYVLRYGGYFVAINMSETKPLSITVPRHEGPELLSRASMPQGRKMTLEPLSSVIFFDPAER
ncbi:hypothetical protein [Novosphingobium resinovorum]|uniref:hypothetical protein n=1 Tax=Novosphingobium resinovorum TaxID=158500 RepID=UPI002ED55B72|nr:hypothetical protein [Novosphingobium resinovorum]